MDQNDQEQEEQSSGESSSEKPRSKFEKMRDSVAKSLEVMAGTPRVIKLIWHIDPVLASAVVLFDLILGVIPIGDLWIGKLIVDAVTQHLSQINLADLKPSSLIDFLHATKLLPLLLTMTGLEVVKSVLQPLHEYVENLLSDRLSHDVEELIFRKANSFVDITFFESAEFYDKLQNAEREAGFRPAHMLNGLLSAARSGVTFVFMAGSFLLFQPLLALIVVLFAVPNFILQFKHHKESWALNQWQVPEVRKMYYYGRVLTSKTTATEIRMFGLGEFFLGKYQKIFEQFREAHQKTRKKHVLQKIILGTLVGLVDVGAYIYLTICTVTGVFSIGSFYFYSNALGSFQHQLWNLVWTISSLYEDNLFVSNLFEFLDTKPPMESPDPTWALAAPKPIKKGIEFRNVSFRYVGAEKDVLSNLNFTLLPNQTVALVGENGAGKTTIVKLLGRLYDPTEGEILVDGINLKELDLESWRRQMSVIFQDFDRYHLTAGENIGIGAINFIHDEIRVKAAAERGGAISVIDKLPKKFETLLVKGYGSEGEETSDLSGGEWQKMALSRAFMRAPFSEINTNDQLVEKHLKEGAAQLLVLDEPTASLDVQSEHEVYLRFQELTEGKTTVLISHRFSTVRMAKHILLLENGKIAEEGTHEELMALAGTYSHLYKLQADKYN